MLTMRRINYITSLYFEESLSIRKISEKTGHHFNTVKKYLEKDDWNTEIKPRKERESKLDPLKEIIDKWLLDDKKAPLNFSRKKLTAFFLADIPLTKRVL